MTLFDTLNHFVEDQQGILQCYEWDIREESNQENPDPWYNEQFDRTKQRLEDLETIKSELARLQRYDEELSKVMNPDFKDWYQNSKEEYPEVAAWVITNLREQLDWAYETIDRLTEQLEGK